MLDNITESVLHTEANIEPGPATDVNSEPSLTEDTNRSPSINEMRNLVGLEPVNTPVENNVNATAASPLVDAEDFVEEEETTQRKLWQRPIPKMAAVALPLGVVCFIVGFILMNLTGMELSSKPDETEEIGSSESLNALTEEQQREEIARLRTANALGNQASILDSQPERRTEIRPATEPTPTRVPTPTEVRQPQTVERPAAPPPAPIERSRPTPISRTPVTPRLPTPRFSQGSSAPIQNARSQFAQSGQPSDPFEEWQKLAGLGSYGQVSSTSAPGNSQASEVIASQIPVSNEPIPILVSNSGGRASNPTVLASSTSRRPLPKTMEGHRSEEVSLAIEARREALPAEETAIAEEVPVASAEGVPEEDESYQAGADFIMRNSEQLATPHAETVILPGISAKGEVVMPVAWAGDIQSTSGAVELTEDLVSNNSVIMPGGTQLIVELDEMSESGMMSLRVTSIILPETGYEHMQIPASAITVQGSNGSVLMAQDVSGVDSELHRLDLGQAFLGALGEVGSILNRPSSSSSAVGLTGSVSSTEYDSPNIVGAILEGSANTLINERSARNQERADELQQRPSVWVLTKGTGIEIFISQAVSLRGE